MPLAANPDTTSAIIWIRTTTRVLAAVHHTAPRGIERMARQTMPSGLATARTPTRRGADVPEIVQSGLVLNAAVTQHASTTVRRLSRPMDLDIGVDDNTMTEPLAHMHRPRPLPVETAARPYASRSAFRPQQIGKRDLVLRATVAQEPGTAQRPCPDPNFRVSDNAAPEPLTWLNKQPGYRSHLGPRSRQGQLFQPRTIESGPTVQF